MLIDSKYRIPVYLSLLLCAILCLTMNLYGVTLDEPVYLTAGRTYVVWAEHPIQHKLDSYWMYGQEHPSFGKVLGGLACYIFHDKLGTVGLVKAFRLQNLIYCFAFCFIMYRWMQELTNKYMAVAAVLVAFFLPRMYFSAHIGMLDYPVTVLIFISSYAFWKGLSDPKHMITASILTGLALATKINGAFLYTFLIVWLLIAWRKELKKRLLYILSLIVIPPALFVLLWPWLWHHPAARIPGYFIRLMQHLPIPLYYLRETYYGNTPWHYPFVLTIATLPCIILAAIGWYALAPRKKTIDWFLIAGALIPLAAIALFSPCKNDGVRLFLPAFPFIAMLASLGIYEYFKRYTHARLAAFTILLCLCIVFAIGTYHRYQECYYNETVAVSHTEAAFETEYETCAYQELVPWLNEHPHSRLYVPVMADHLMIHQALGELSTSVECSAYKDADYVVILEREGFFDEVAWSYRCSNRAPVFAIKEGNGIPILSVYKKYEGAEGKSGTRWNSAPPRSTGRL
ncbi:MAG: ArnT family glycosyltransferase [Candidatus Brocadiia bacterium]